MKSPCISSIDPFKPWRYDGSKFREKAILKGVINMAKYVINRMDLGKRITGYKVYVSESKDFLGLTEKQIKNQLAKGDRVYGFLLDSEGNLKLDNEGFHKGNLMIETGIGTLKPVMHAEAAINVFYVVVSAIKGKAGTTYEVISSRYGRSCITEDKLKVLMEIGCITGGVYLDNRGKVAICEGVEVLEEAQ